MEWLRMAFVGEPKVEISSWELDRGGVSYSIDTLRALAVAHPKAELFYLIGADHVATLTEWREADALAAAATFVVVPRPGASEMGFPKPFRGRYLRGEPMAVSAREIRQRLRSGRSVEDFVPPPVAQILNSMQIYSEN
jgi:nicotinate-nucleotide adenylyltransferase